MCESHRGIQREETGRMLESPVVNEVALAQMEMPKSNVEPAPLNAQKEEVVGYWRRLGRALLGKNS